VIDSAARHTLESAIKECSAHLDQFIYRYTKLQDSLARRLLPALYGVLENDDSPRAFLDILNRLEQLGVVPDKERWQVHRNLRNNLAHDYPESIEQTVATLNQLFESWRDLEQLFEAALTAYNRHASP